MCLGAVSAAVSTALGPCRLQELLGAHRLPCGLPAVLAGTPRPSLGQRLLEKGSAAQNQLRFPAGQFLLLYRVMWMLHHWCCLCAGLEGTSGADCAWGRRKELWA